MRFLLRLAFWLGVVAVLLPRSEAQPQAPTPVSASEAIAAATATVSDMAKFCDRQPEACTVGTQAAEALGDRARTGAKRLYEMLNEKLAADPKTAVPATNAKSVPLPPVRPTQRAAATTSRNPQSGARQAASPDTLTPADLAPIWRDPMPHRKEPGEPT